MNRVKLFRGLFLKLGILAGLTLILSLVLGLMGMHPNPVGIFIGLLMLYFVIRLWL